MITNLIKYKMAGNDQYQNFTDDDFVFRRVVRQPQAPQTTAHPEQTFNTSPSIPTELERNERSPQRTYQMAPHMSTIADASAQPLTQTVSTKPRIDLTADSPLPNLPYPRGMPIIAESSRDSISTSADILSIRRASPAAPTPFIAQV